MTVVQLLLSGLTVLASVAALSVTDPTGDSVGDGTVVAPTAPRYANSAIFDLHDVDLTSQPAAAAGAAAGAVPTDAGTSELRVTVGAIDRTESTALGFGSMVLDVYLDAVPGGHDMTLAGPDMLFPTGQGWEYAVRVTPDGATGYVFVGHPDGTTDAAGGVLVDEPGAGQGTRSGDEDAPSGADQDDLDDESVSGEQETVFETVPVGVFIDGSTISIELPWSLPESTVVYALTGVHDPFNPSGWRPLAASPSPWAYSGGEQVVPVIDLLAPDQDAQVRALRTGVLPQPSVPVGASGVVWLVLMGVGVVVALAGLLLRRRVPAPATRGRTTGLPPDPEAEQVAARPVQRPVQRPAQPAVAVPLPQRVRTDDAPRWAPVQVAVDDETVASASGGQESAPGVDAAPADEEPATEEVEAEEPATEEVEAERPETVEPPEVATDARTPVTGNSAFDSYVLYGPDDDEDTEGFDELAKGDGPGAAG